MTEAAVETRPERRTIFELFAEAKRRVGPVGKNSHNQQQNFNYRGVDAVVNAISAAFDDLGIIPAPLLERYEYREGVEIGRNRSLMGHVQVEVTYRFYGPAGDFFDAKVPGESMDSGDKATAKAMSVAYRICLLQALNLPTGDPDPDSQTYERSTSYNGSRNGSDFDNAAPAPRGSQERHQNGRDARQEPAPVPEALAKDDPWALKIEEITSVEDADAVEAELKRLFEAKDITGDRAAQVLHWIRVKAAPMRTAAKSGPHPAPDPEPEGPSNSPALAELSAELEVTPLEGIQAFRSRLGGHVASRKITPDEAAALSADALKRKRQLEEAAAKDEAGEADAA